jgi:hypothetical protein
MSWVVPRLLNSVLLQKQGNVQRPTVKRPNLGRQQVEEDLGWSLLELISRRRGRRPNEDGKERQATRSLMGTLLLPPCLATLKICRRRFPVPTFVPFSDPTLGLCEPKKERVSHTNPVFEALIFHRLIQTQVRREGESRDSKVKSQWLHRPSGKINF